MTNRPDQTREKNTRTERPDVDRPGETPRATDGSLQSEKTQAGAQRPGTTDQPGSKPNTGGQRDTAGTERGKDRDRRPEEESDVNAADEDRDVTGEDDSDRESRIDKEGGRGATSTGNPRP